MNAAQYATDAEAKEIAEKLGNIGGGVKEAYVPEYSGPFAPWVVNGAKFLHFRFNNGAEGVNVGLVRETIAKNPFTWPNMIGSEVAAMANPTGGAA